MVKKWPAYNFTSKLITILVDLSDPLILRAYLRHIIINFGMAHPKDPSPGRMTYIPKS